MGALAPILRGHGTDTPEAVFIDHLASGHVLSYGAALETARALTAVLTDLGVGKKDKVAFVVRNHWLFFPLLVACNARRAVLVPIDPDLHRDELAFILKDAGPKVTILADGGSAPPAKKGKRLPLSDLLGLADAVKDSPALDETPHGDVALMIYTSGTTGTNKCVMLTDANLVANATALATRYAVGPTDRLFCNLPTHHMNAIMMTGMTPMVAGAAVHLSDILSFKNAKHFWRTLAERSVTICSLVPSIMALLLKLFPRGADADLSGLRFGFCGAAPLPPHTRGDIEQVFGFPIHQGYGLTETTCWAVSTLPDGPRRYDSVGVPLDTEVVIDASRGLENARYLIDQMDAVAHENVTGEVLIKGGIVCPGYFKNAKLTKRCMTREGFFRTGDLGYFDADGRLHINGRIKEIIIRNGTNVFSQDIDATLRAHPAVAQVKTVGVPDDLVGERIYSTCVLEEGAGTTARELKAWAQERLSRHMWPDVVTLMGYLPAGGTGKIATGVLRDILTGGLADTLLASLNTWKFKRAQPSRPQEIRAAIQRSLLLGTPFDLVTYWGCGTRDDAGEVDHLALERLDRYLDGLRRGPQAAPRVTLILTDTHAQNNRIPEARSRAYFEAIASCARERDMDAVYMSALWAEAGLTSAQIQADLAEPDAEALWQDHPQRDGLIAQAAKHVEQGGDVETAARTYLATCAREGRVIADRYPHGVFATYNPPAFDCVSPPLPTVYLYSYKDRTSVKPWFVDDGLP